MTANWVAVFGLALFFNANTVEPFPIVTTVSGICPQNRKTERAPGRYLEKVNPLAPNKNIEKGRKLFSEEATDPMQGLSWEQGERQWQSCKEDRATSQKFYLWTCDAGFARWSVILGYLKWLKRHRYAGT